MTVIAAPTGFRLVRAFRGENDLGTDVRSVSEIVLAFRIDHRETYPLPITPTGEVDLEKPWLLVHPDGHLSMAGDHYSSFVEWQSEVVMGD